MILCCFVPCISSFFKFVVVLSESIVFPFPNFFVISNPELFWLSKMVSRLLIGDNNLSRFWPSYQFSRSSLKGVVLCTATDLDTFDHGLSQVEDRDVVIISVLTSILLEEVNQLEVESSAANICEQSLSRLFGLCPTIPGCQVRFYFFSCLEVAEK